MAKKFTERASEIMSEGKVSVTKDELGTHVTLALGKEHKKMSWGSYSPAAAYEVVIPSAGKVQLMSQNLKKGVKEKLGAAIKAALQGAKLSGAVPIVKKTLANMDVGSLTEAKASGLEPDGIPFSKEEKMIIRGVAKRLAKADDPETAHYLEVDFTSGPGWATVLVPFKDGANIVKVRGGYEVRTIGGGLRILGRYGYNGLEAAVGRVFGAPTSKRETVGEARKPAKPRETGKPNRYTMAADDLIRRVKSGKLDKAAAQKEVMKLIAGILK